MMRFGGGNWCNVKYEFFNFLLDMDAVTRHSFTNFPSDSNSTRRILFINEALDLSTHLLYGIDKHPLHIRLY